MSFLVRLVTGVVVPVMGKGLSTLCSAPSKAKRRTSRAAAAQFRALRFSDEGMQTRCEALQCLYLWVVTAQEPLPEN